MNIIKGLFLATAIFLVSCDRKGKIESKTDNQNDSTEITHEFVQVSKKINEFSTAEYYYMITNKDSFLNQIKIYKNGKLDTLNSRFFNLKVTKNDGLNHSGHIYYRNYLDTLDLEINKDRWIFFYLEQQITKDSIAHKIFASEDGNNIYYEYLDFENGTISGYIEDTALIPSTKKDSLGKNMVRHIEHPMNIQRIIEIN